MIWKVWLYCVWWSNSAKENVAEKEKASQTNPEWGDCSRKTPLTLDHRDCSRKDTSVEIAAEKHHLPLIIETAVGKTQSPQKPPHCFILPCQNGVHSHKLRPVRISHGEGLKFIYKIYNTTEYNTTLSSLCWGICFLAHHLHRTNNITMKHLITVYYNYEV